MTHKEIKKKSISTCLLFIGNLAGNAEEATTFYISIFDNSRIMNIEHYGPDEDEPVGSVKIARFILNNVEYIAMDNALNHKFGFTPSMSLLIECESIAEITALYQTLAKGGSELVPIGDHSYSDSKQFGWLNDRYGLSWQLNLI